MNEVTQLVYRLYLQYIVKPIVRNENEPSMWIELVEVPIVDNLQRKGGTIIESCPLDGFLKESLIKDWDHIKLLQEFDYLIKRMIENREAIKKILEKENIGN